jgi:hypothetical protein
LPRIEWRPAAKGAAGFLLGLAIWTLVGPSYDRFVARATEAVMRATENPPVTRLPQADDDRITIDREDFDPRSPRPGIPVRDLTFNFVLLTALFAASKRTFSDRNIGGFVAACGILAITHVFGFVAKIMSIYTGRLGPWSEANYGDFARSFWGVADHFYRLVLMYAIAFALWWIFRDARTQDSAGKTARKKKKR